MKDRKLSVKDLADRLGIHLNSAYLLIWKHKIPAVRTDGRRGCRPLRDYEIERLLTEYEVESGDGENEDGEVPHAESK
jgi:excisionase family DNA binding protein